MAIYVPIVMYGLRLFIVVLQELHCLPNIYRDNAISVSGFANSQKELREISAGVYNLLKSTQQHAIPSVHI